MGKAAKQQRKLLPRLKPMMANPIKKRCPLLDDQELEVLYEILKSSIESSAVEPSKYATNNRICLGLESSLRCINNCKSSCVFISLSIKPIHIVSLISRNAEVKDSTQLVFVQPHLEEFTEKLFGIRALCMVLPKDLLGICENLSTWVERRRKPKVESKKEQEVFKSAKRKIKSKQLEVSTKRLKVLQDVEVVKDKLPDNIEDKKSFVADFISVGEDVGDFYVKDDKTEALNALTQVIGKIPKQPITTKKDPLSVEVDDIEIVVPEKMESSEDSIDFLDSYKPMIVHMIKKNPNKKPKKKRNKKRNENRNKNPKK